VIRVKAGSDSREKRAAEMEAKENILRAQGSASVGALLRFHQWNAVLKLEADAGGNAVGHSS